MKGVKKPTRLECRICAEMSQFQTMSRNIQGGVTVSGISNDFILNEDLGIHFIFNNSILKGAIGIPLPLPLIRFVSL